MDRYDYIEKEITRIQAENSQKLRENYRKLQKELENSPEMAAAEERKMLTEIYYNLLVECENRIKKAWSSHGQMLGGKLWTQISLKFQKPEFIYLDISKVDESVLKDTIKKSTQEKMDYAKFVPPAMTGIIGLGILVIPKIPNICSVPFFLLGGALFIKVFKDKDRGSKIDRQDNIYVSLEEVVEEQWKENDRLFKKWFQQLFRYVKEVMEASQKH